MRSSLLNGNSGKGGDQAGGSKEGEELHGEGVGVSRSWSDGEFRFFSDL